MAGAECECNEGPNAGTCPVIKDSAQHESFVRQQHHSPPGLTPECRAALSSKAGRMSFAFLCLLWKIWSFFSLFLICFSSKENIFWYACSMPEDVCVSGGALGARREADGLRWWSEGSSSPCLGRGYRKMAGISRSRMHDGRPPLRKHNSPFPRLQQPCLDKMCRDSFLPAYSHSAVEFHSTLNHFSFKENVLPFC